jgi:hypothetical protein
MKNDPPRHEPRAETSAALAAAKASLKTARISLDELERLRAETRAEAPSFEALESLLDRPFDNLDVQAVVGPLSLRLRTLMNGAEAANKANGIRVLLDERRRVASIVLYAVDNEVGAASWSGPLLGGLSIGTDRAELRRAFGRVTTVEVDGGREERFSRPTCVVCFVIVDERFVELRLRRGSP